MVWQELFLHTSIRASGEVQEFENVTKNSVFLILSCKTKFHHFRPP